ncbi:B12-binding domain-containing radical SAM protein [Actinacidiphila sp. ITFR-21]|uniref:B12-binding domain-containing radical SAM protein n=1 Tax=Actinacidiphila sp. ITFR-21 TaxID=3075199 RepID=UPI00288C3C2B|nr:radical SAM protein [Streptomyces sp. ITFR-21]WNI18054.1 radical SAM protein [Streptomyces sp. ITFR-21]
MKGIVMDDLYATETVRRLDQAVRTAHTDVHPLSAGEQRELADLLVATRALRDRLEERLHGLAVRVRVTGTLERRLVMIERADGMWTAADLSGRSHRSRRWPAWTRGRLEVTDPDSWLSTAVLEESAVERFSRPDVLLAALYHPENFPLPRFPLGISDVARAARGTLLGTVTLADMQLGTSAGDLIEQLTVQRPDIFGLSATFGQHDLMLRMLDAAFSLTEPPTVVVGGSLTVRNEALLLDRYPQLLVARANGEATIEGVLAHWHGDIAREEIPGLGYNGATRGGALAVGRRRTAKPVSREAADDILPELDLLPATFEHHGVAQMETSRGCTNFCSFCPRGHKGTWAGAAPGELPWMLTEMRRVFDRYPEVSRTLYLVDEEIIGRRDDAVERVLELARQLQETGFRWESSCRIDQVVRTDRDEDWHLERARMWRVLHEKGLRRMLFGVESGVDSILTRFNKETTGEQNALAIRTLSALGIPTRFTYITFDPLMTLEELKATYAFQGRTDLLLHPQDHRLAEKIVRGVRDERFVAENATGRPLHSGISYMLVSMECLIGAAYTRRAAEAGLTGEAEPLMGRVACAYADWRIGVASAWGQRWVDRHFALDYTLKSLEKILDGQPRHAVRGARVVLKDAAYLVLGDMIGAIESAPPGHPGREEELSRRIAALLEDRVGELRERMAPVLEQMEARLPGEHAAMLRREHGRWLAASQWRLINAGDTCGT